jgi:sarcosine oxidase subunit alpha
VTGRRLDAGGLVDRGRPVPFRFGERELTGLAGDSLTSALLANGVDALGPSPILGRPRGVVSAGVEEPSAFVEVSEPWFDPIVAATTVELAPGLVAGARAGVGRLPADPASVRTPRSDARHVHVETLVVGGGASGRAAAAEAVRRGDRVLLVDEGWLDRGPIAEGAAFLRRATAIGVYDAGYVVVHERADPWAPEARQRVWHVRAGRVVLASGAHERPVAFGGNDRPGVMLASAIRTYVERFAVLPGERAVLLATNDDAYAAARALRAAGAEVVAIADVRAASPGQDEARTDGFDVRAGSAIVATEGTTRVSGVRLTDGSTLDADLVGVAGGWNPVTQLWRAIGGGLRYDEALACFVPDGAGPAWLDVVGTAAGAGLPPTAPTWSIHADDLREHFVDLQRDQTVADVADAVTAGLRSVEHVKRATYIGTALDQGRTSGAVTAALVNDLLGWGPDAQGPTNARPPYAPMSFAALAGRERGARFDAARTTPIHGWHVERGAVFEDVGLWKRPWSFPADDEDPQAAVARECLAVRTGVGVMDASTLGKIEVVGPAAAAFLDRMYTNTMSTLPVGRIRYGLMCSLDGMVLDDGVAMRLGEDRYLVTTTTGGAAAVLDRFEEWLQTQWPHLRVYCTSVTEAWATVAVAGPRARDVLRAAGTDVDVSRAAFPFMTFRDGRVAGIPARVCRISFSGELAYEVNVEAWYGRALWEALMAAGEPLAIAPYGTEAMHVLRAEKGFPIIGQETDGTVTPHDLGMGWIVHEAKGDFVGRRSLRRPHLVRPDRRRLVGLLPADPRVGLPEGSQLVLEDLGRVPMPMAGHVTSSYASPALGRTFALALLERGDERIGETVYAPLASGTVAATVTSSVFWDPDHARRDGEPGEAS